MSKKIQKNYAYLLVTTAIVLSFMSIIHSGNQQNFRTPASVKKKQSIIDKILAKHKKIIELTQEAPKKEVSKAVVVIEEAKSEVVAEEAKPEMAEVSKEEQADRKDKVVCLEREDYNHMLSDIKYLKKRLETITSAIPPVLLDSGPVNRQMGMNIPPQRPFFDMSLMGYNPMMGYNPWTVGFSPFSNSMMGQDFFTPMPTPMSQVLSSSYPIFSAPINITNNNYFYGHPTTAPMLQKSPIPQNYFTSEMNFGGLDQVTFNTTGTNQQPKKIPAFFNF